MPGRENPLAYHPQRWHAWYWSSPFGRGLAVVGNSFRYPLFNEKVGRFILPENQRGIPTPLVHHPSSNIEMLDPVTHPLPGPG